jgi:hypothetical protein
LQLKATSSVIKEEELKQSDTNDDERNGSDLQQRSKNGAERAYQVIEEVRRLYGLPCIGMEVRDLEPEEGAASA